MRQRSDLGYSPPDPAVPIGEPLLQAEKAQHNFTVNLTKILAIYIQQGVPRYRARYAVAFARRPVSLRLERGRRGPASPPN